MTQYPRNRTSPAVRKLREAVHDEADRCMDALEFGLEVATARERILDALSVYGFDVAARREKRKTA